VFDRARQAVLNVFYNVDLIKVTVGDGISPPELTAIVEEAHREHLKVADHAIDTASIQTAISRRRLYRAWQQSNRRTTEANAR